MATETWAPVAGHEGFYVVSDHGHVKSLLFDPVGRPMTPLVYRKGYLKFAFARPAYSRDFAHRVVWQAFRGPIPEGVTVNHIDGNPANNALVNLELATPKEQVAHAERIGLRVRCRGSGHSAAKLTEASAKAIYDRYHTGGTTMKRLAADYGVSAVVVHGIIHRKRWPHIHDG